MTLLALHVPFGLSSVKDPAHSGAEFREQLPLFGRRPGPGKVDNAHQLVFPRWRRVAIPDRLPFVAFSV
jgi:hypothetical protein